MRNGPHIEAKCFGCAHVDVEKYRSQGDSGVDVSCTHPDIGNRHVGDTLWTTPIWCPLLVEAASAFVAHVNARKASKDAP